jgi:hypothetical protein
MSANPNLFVLIAGVLAVVLPFWPLVVLAGFLARPQRPLWPMVVAWSVMLLCWIAERFVRMPSLLRIIPEPLNTALFFAAGLLIAALFLARKPLRLRL